VLVMLVRTQTRGQLRLQGLAEDHVGRGEEGSGKWESRFKLRDLLADRRCSQAVLDFLSATYAGRLVRLRKTQGVRRRSENPGSGEREGERRVEAEELGAEGEGQCVPPHALLYGVRRRGVGDGHCFLCSFLLSFPLWFPWCASHLLATGLGRWRTGAFNVLPLRGLRTGSGLYIHRIDLAS